MERSARRRDTRQRALVLAIVASTESHPTADWVYERARRAMPKISLGTVYRNLQLLAREGKIRAIDAWGRATRFDADLSDHDHFLCVDCGAIHDVPRRPGDEARIGRSFSARGFTLTGHRLEFRGRCPNCSTPRRKPSAETNR